ncbi:HRDC-like protein [Papiliotrema laurentii]|uniref:HRDC-like protein n=1 Tax=Papiliotrema laurentii TaxID=5418 RepID=A0AAD9CWM0_PAPLA|nr:HRDC-like protein [Papiliotrema laurentii]
MVNRPAEASRSRKHVAVEEDATKLQFGDFLSGDALTATDVKTLLQAARIGRGDIPLPDNKIYRAAVAYVDEFANLPVETIESMRNEITSHGAFLNKFEVAQILQLQPADRGTAVALIPSLERFDKEEDLALLSQILDNVRNIARYGST